jgi:hypothetical protein
MLSSQPWRDQSQDLKGDRVVIKAGQARLHVSLSQLSPGASTDELVDTCLPVVTLHEIWTKGTQSPIKAQ